MKRNEEIVTASFKTKPAGFGGGLNVPEIQEAINVDFQADGIIQKRRGYNTFGEMVHVLWDINKRFRKQGFSGEFTVKLPLKGTKPIYKKTLAPK